MDNNEMEIDGLDEIEEENTPIMDLETEDVNLMFLGIDCSGSMEEYKDVMKEELEKFKSSIENSKESERILVARADFSGFLKIRGYKHIDEFDTDYRTYGSTKMYDTIIDGSKKLREYMTYLREHGMRVKAVLAVFSDGYDNASRRSRTRAKSVIKDLNRMEILTAFICFGDEALEEARALGIKDEHILRVGQSESELRKAFNTLSKSVISHSQSVAGENDDFFER